MGLDMYLQGKRFLWNINDESPDAKIATDVAAMFPELTPNKRWGKEQSRVKEITCEAAYWRKANAIHQWFVKNCQNNKDDCGEYGVSRDQLKELIDLCKQVLANRELAEKLLPSQAGFFFGSTEYDDYYLSDLQSTIDQLEPWLDESREQWDLYYHSSW